MKIITKLVILIAFFVSGLLSPTLAFSQAEEENISSEKWDKPVHPELYENSDINASGCQMEESPYSSGGAFTYGEKYIFVWHTQTEGLLYSLNNDHLLVPSFVTFHGNESEIPYTFESLGGMWSGLFFQDVFGFLIENEFEIISEVSLKTLSEISEKQTCNIQYKNLERYIDWIYRDSDEQGEEN